jgi:hypothetical protein
VLGVWHALVASHSMQPVFLLLCILLVLLLPGLLREWSDIFGWAVPSGAVLIRSGLRACVLVITRLLTTLLRFLLELLGETPALDQ